MSAESDMEVMRQTVWRMAEDITRIKRVCTQEHPPKMASPTRDWEPGTETRHSDGTRCVLLNDGDCAVIFSPGSQGDT